MEKIIITIPDNLSQQEEIAAIAKELTKKYLPGNTQKALGTGYELKHLETQIIIQRKSVEKVLVTVECSKCGTIYEKDKGFKLYTNYGGRTKKIFFCSDECRQFLIDHAGNGRVALTRNKLTAFRNFSER